MGVGGGGGASGVGVGGEEMCEGEGVRECVSGSWVSTADCLSAVESLYLSQISRLLAAPCSRDWPTHIMRIRTLRGRTRYVRRRLAGQ